MREIHAMVDFDLSAELDALHRRHGSWRLAWGLIGTLVRRSLRQNHIADLNAHMRRDIGLIDCRDLDEERLSRQMEWKRFL